MLLLCCPAWLVRVAICRLLDCGCVTGNNLALLRPYGRAFGFDLTPTGVTCAASTGHAVARASITQIPFASRSFDVATSFDVLQLIRDDSAAVKEMARVVRPGGAVLITVAAFEALRGDHSLSWNEAHRYTRGQTRALLESAGLQPELVTFMFASLFPLVVGARTWQRVTRPLRSGIRHDADISVPAAPVNTLLSWMVESEARLARLTRMPIGSSILAVGRKPSS